MENKMQNCIYDLYMMLLNDNYRIKYKRLYSTYKWGFVDYYDNEQRDLLEKYART